MSEKLSRRRFLQAMGGAAGVALVAPVLAACVPSPTPTPQPAAKPAAATAAPQATEAPKKAVQPVEIVHWGRSPTEEEVVWSKIVALAKKTYPELSVKLAAPAENMTRKLLVSFAGGTAPDSTVDGLSAFRGWIGMGAMRSIQPYIDADKEVQAWLPEYVPAAIKGYSYKGQLYAVPTVNECILLWYHKDAVLEAGLTPPAEIEKDPKKWNWDTMLEYAKKLNKGTGFRRQRFGIVTTAAKSVNGITESWGNLVYARGGRVMDEDGENWLLNSPETSDALQFVVDLIYKYDVHPDVGESMSANVRDRAFFQNGQMGMVIQGEYFRRYLWGTGKPSEGIKFKYDLALVPVCPATGKRANMYHGNGTWMTSQTKVPDAVWKWLKTVFTQEAQQIITDNWGSRGGHRGTYDPWLKSNAGGGPDGLNYQAFVEADKDTEPYYLTPYLTKEAVLEPMVRILYDNVFQKKMSVPEGLAQIEKETKALIEKGKKEWEAKQKK